MLVGIVEKLFHAFELLIGLQPTSHRFAFAQALKLKNFEPNSPFINASEQATVKPTSTRTLDMLRSAESTSCTRLKNQKHSASPSLHPS